MPEFQRRPTSLAQKLRREATHAERELWTYLSARKVGGHKFSRQMPIGPFVCDFLCRSERLVIELDGFSHDLNIAADARRDEFMSLRGYRVLRFTNQQIFDNIEGVLIAIERALAAGPPPAPPACGRGVTL